MTTEYYMSREDYFRRLQAYLNRQIALGWLREEEGLWAWQGAARSTGRPTPDFPYYKEVQQPPTEFRRIPTYPITPPTTRYDEYTAIREEAKAQAEIRPGETTLQRLRRLEAWLPQARQVDVRPSEKMQHPWLAVSQEIEAIRRRFGAEGLKLEEAYPTGKFEEVRAGVVGARPWTDWFESKYSRELGRFRATLPSKELLPGKRWSEYLKKRKPELKEEYAERYPYGIGGRPWAFQPKIKTVSF